MRDDERPEKRRFQECEFVDLPYLVNASRALTENELKRKLPNTVYPQYLAAFLKRRTQDVFTKYYTKQWLKDRYFSTQFRDVYTGDVKKCIQIRGISGDTQLSSIFSTVTSAIPDAKVLVSQHGQEKDFGRSLYVISETVDPDTAVALFTGLFDVGMIDISGCEIKDLNMASVDQIKGVFDEILKYEEPKVGEISEEKVAAVVAKNSVAEYAKFLRENFYFCVDCCKKFDNQFEMALNCSKHTQNDFCSRNYSIIGYPKNFAPIKEGIESLHKYYAQDQDGQYQCNICEKLFADPGLVKTHLKDAHDEIVSRVTEYGQRLAEFLDHIDFFMLEVVLGTGIKSVPHYGICDMREGDVVYDLPCTFSGAIKFE